MKGFLVVVMEVPRWRWPTISLMCPRYSLRVIGLYPRVFSVDVVDGEEADGSPNGFMEAVAEPAEW